MSFSNSSNNSNNSLKLPLEGHIYQGKVIKIESYGVFIEIDGYKSNGLVHISQISQTRIEKPEDVINIGEYVYVKVISIENNNNNNNNSHNNKPKISLSMKYCDQTTGEDRDRHNIDLESSKRKKRFQPIEQGPLQLDAIYNTICGRCGGKGHIQSECYNTNGEKYELLPLEEEEVPSINNNENNINRGGGRGRGREATLPAWMTSGKLSETSQSLEGGIKIPSSLSSTHSQSSQQRLSSSFSPKGLNDDDRKLERNYQIRDSHSNYSRDDSRFSDLSPQIRRSYDNNHEKERKRERERERSREREISRDIDSRRKRSRSKSISSESSNSSSSSSDSSDRSSSSNKQEKKKSKKKHHHHHHHSKKKSHKHKHHKHKHHKHSKKDSKKEK